MCSWRWGCIKETEKLYYVGQQVKAIIYSLFAWEDGRLPDQLPGQGHRAGDQADLPPAMLIIRGVKKLYKPERLRRSSAPTTSPRLPRIRPTSWPRYSWSPGRRSCSRAWTARTRWRSPSRRPSGRRMLCWGRSARSLRSTSSKRFSSANESGQHRRVGGGDCRILGGEHFPAPLFTRQHQVDLEGVTSPAVHMRSLGRRQDQIWRSLRRGHHRCDRSSRAPAGFPSPALALQEIPEGSEDARTVEAAAVVVAVADRGRHRSDVAPVGVFDEGRDQRVEAAFVALVQLVSRRRRPRRSRRRVSPMTRRRFSLHPSVENDLHIFRELLLQRLGRTLEARS